MEEVSKFLKALKASPEGWAAVPDEKKLALSNAATAGSQFTAEELWSVAEADDRKEFLCNDQTTRKFVRSISENIGRLCGLVEKHIADHLKKNGGSDLMDLIHFHSKGNGGEGVVVTTSPRAASQEALSDPNSCGSSVGSTLNASQIHHNMFNHGSELDKQAFVRFAFPDQDMIETLKLDACGDKIGLLANEMKAIRSFLSCLSCDEQLTQAVFKVFLTNLLVELIPEGRLSAQSVSGMETLRINAVVSEEYMKKISKKQKLNNAVSATEKRVKLAIQSDLVVWKGEVPTGLVSRAADQKNMFLNCNINVEMKKYDLLKGNKNKPALTQVAAESLARKKALSISGPTRLYSILTDISGLYVLWHEVKGGAERDVYWVSRQETDPERFVASLYWMCLHSMNDESVVEFDSKWEQPAAAAEIQEEGKDEHGSGDVGELHSIDEDEPSNHANACGSGNVDGADEEECEDMVIVSFDDSDEEEDNEADQWSTFYAIENHRILGTSLPLTRNLLELHTASHSC
mmetsp:Transcript_25171/g.45560  ORF Transcript_25171/g.45560 Transcript_25171/m.45560 type:complete len:518 (-) Transcript_25171:502-2055(-)